MADAGGKKYIGQIESLPLEGDTFNDDVSGDLIGNITDGIPIRLTNAWAMIEMDLVIPGPQGPQGIQHVCHCRPANNSQEACSFLLVPTLVHLFSDMSDADRKRNKELVDQVDQNARENRAKRANITLAGPGALPPPGGFRGPGRPPGLS